MLASIALIVSCTTAEPGTATADEPIDSTAEEHSTSETSTDTDTGDSTAGDSGEAAPCEAAPGVPGEDVTLTIQWEGRPRKYNVHIPAGYDCSPRPLLIGLHYYTGTAHNFEHETAGIHDFLDEEGVIGIFPEAMGRGGGDDAWVTAFNDISSHNDDGPDGATCTGWAWDYGVFADCPAEEAERSCFWGTSCADDVGMTRAIIEQAMATWTIDERRVYLTGFSQGGISTQTWSRHLQDLIAAAAPLHGFAANGHTVAPTEGVSLMQVWGTYDIAINGWDSPSMDGLIYDSAAETAAIWADAQGCSPIADTPYATVSDGKTGWRCTQHDDCDTGADVVTCQWEHTHLWGRDSVNGNFMWDAVWEFFESHPKP